MNCNFKTIDMNTHRCEMCDFIIKSNQSSDKIYKMCSSSGSPKAEVNEPNIIQKGINLTAASAAHMANYFRPAPQEVVDERLKICQSCPELNVNDNCNLCGCPIAEKASWASSYCPHPMKKWLPYKNVDGEGGCCENT